MSLSLVFIFMNIIVLIAIVFLNASKAKILATSTGIVAMILVTVKIYDMFINGNAIEDYIIDIIKSLNLTNDTLEHTTFIAGLFVLLQVAVLWIMIHVLLRRFISYKPPILLTKREMRMMRNESTMWKILLYFIANVMLLYIMPIFNFATNLELGFLSELFSLGFGVR